MKAALAIATCVASLAASPSAAQSPDLPQHARVRVTLQRAVLIAGMPESRVIGSWQPPTSDSLRILQGRRVVSLARSNVAKLELSAGGRPGKRVTGASLGGLLAAGALLAAQPDFDGEGEVFVGAAFGLGALIGGLLAPGGREVWQPQTFHP